ncbi:mitochondrial import inner membrane translocase subunit Tim21 [Oxyura jamaicensis]|uniref:mitochondrial import inner membrane translocase subunit Tim21 n=1 Tax=Oxyura jamaicensis TaxID=8884 RepID=UPI0015A695A8|nr:mitochondrial import inner membrane translocase subunit Tim21 [Oxyura jamaicensis]
MLLPAALVRGGGQLRVPLGRWPPAPCLRWRRQPPLSPSALLRGARASVWTQAGGLGADKSGHESKHVSVRRDQKDEALLSAARKVKEAGRDFTYFIVVLVGIGVTGGLFYVIFKELFSSSSPSKIYGDALEKCRSHPEVIGVFGEPIKGYGEATRRGRRQLVSHIEYVKDGLKHMRLKFYIEGSEPGKRGTVHVEVKENPEGGKPEVRYIFVDVDTYPRRTIIIEDNR